MSTTAGAVKTLAVYHVTSTGQQYVTSDSDLYALLSDRLLALSVRAKAIYEDAVDFTPVENQRNYDYYNPSAVFKIAGTNRAMVEITNVIINGVSLNDTLGRYGRTTQDDMTRFRPDYIGTAAATPLTWWTTEPGTLHLWPKPTAAVVTAAACYVQGWWKHPAVTQSSDTLYFPDEDKEFLAMDLAAHLMRPYAVADSAAYAKMKDFESQVNAWVKYKRNKTESETSSPSVRGVPDNAQIVELGYASRRV